MFTFIRVFFLIPSPHIQGLHDVYIWYFKLFIHFLGPPSVSALSCVNLSEDVSGAVNVTVRCTLSRGDSADFYLINITTNAPLTPYEGILNITTASVTQYKLTGFIAEYEYDITVSSVNCGNQKGSENEPLTIRPQGKFTFCLFACPFKVLWLFGIHQL